jgi:hypothetical protein
VRMDEQLVEKSGRKKYITERSGTSSWEEQGIVAFCIRWMNEWMTWISACKNHIFRGKKLSLLLHSTSTMKIQMTFC